MFRFLKSSLCLTLIFLILAQPCFAYGPVSITPTLTPALSPTNFTVRTELLNNSFYPHLLHKSLVNACSKIGEGLNSQTSFGLHFTSLTFRKVSAHLTYDYENRLTSVSNSTNSTYTYDGLGRRISKTVNGGATYFIYDGDQIIEERDATGQLIANYVYGTGIDECLRMTRNNKDYYYHYDGLGSVSDITNASNEVVESYSYDVYGNPSQLSTIGNRFYFTGREFDAETGLYNYRRRYYSPSIGRFLSRDPVTEGTLMSMNQLKVREFPEELQELVKIPLYQFGFGHPYLYTRNNPINYVDPHGLWYIDINLTFGFGVGGFGITGGFIISPEGIFKYSGFGLSTPGPGGSITFSPDNPTFGWNAGWQVSFIGAYQGGRDFATLTDFREFGIGWPGASFMMFYVDNPWVWPWRSKDKDCN